MIIIIIFITIVYYRTTIPASDTFKVYIAIIKVQYTCYVSHVLINEVYSDVMFLKESIYNIMFNIV
jgi:hypothetical protein